MKFKVGDKVRVKESYFAYFYKFPRSFIEDKGKIYEIENIIPDKQYTLKNCCWRWREDFLELVDESIKYKIVVNETKEKNFIITYKWLKENRACEDKLLWFVENFGNKAYYKDVIERLNLNKNNFYKDWIGWLKYRIGEIEIDKDKYVLVDNVNLSNIYILKCDNNLYKLHRIDTNIFTFIRLNNTTNRWDVSCQRQSINDFIRKTLCNCCINAIIYEFKNLKDFSEWLSKELGE